MNESMSLFLGNGVFGDVQPSMGLTILRTKNQITLKLSFLYVRIFQESVHSYRSIKSNSTMPDKSFSIILGFNQIYFVPSDKENNEITLANCDCL